MEDGEEEDENQVIEIAKMLKYNDDDNHVNKEEIHYELSEIDDHGKFDKGNQLHEDNQLSFVKRINKPVVFVAVLTFFLVILNFALSSTVLGLTYLLVDGTTSNNNIKNDLSEYNMEKILDLPFGTVCGNPVLQQTFEYQFSLNPKDFISRTSEIEKYTSYISSITGINLNSTNGEANVRLQYDLLTTECGNEYYIRVRNYIWGPSAGITSVDVKKSVMDKPETCDATLNLASAEDLVEYNFEKVEQDIHPCMSKYSRESRLFDIPFNPDLTTCGAISELFPYLFPDPVAVADVHLNHGATTTWFSYRANGTFPTPHNMLYLIDFTFPYKTIELAKAGVTQCEPAAELSMRVWGYGQNLYNTPNTYQDLWIVNNWYNQILGQFGSWENFPCYKYGMYNVYYD